MRILIPIDFSEVSVNAIKYAYDLFSDAEIKVVHAVAGLLDPKDPMVLRPWIPKDISIKEDLQRMIRDEFKNSKYPEKINVEILFGEVVPALRDYVKHNPFDAIIMGTRDKYDLFDRWIGTNSLGVLKSIDLPIYLIPKYAKYEGFSKVVIASDAQIASPKMIGFIKSWNIYNAFIKFVHIREDEEDTFNFEEQKIFASLFEQGDPTFGFEVQVVDSEDVSASLLSIAYSDKADLVITIPGKQSFFQALFFKSVSKVLVQKSSVPMLFLTEESVDHDIWSNVLQKRETIK